MRGWRRDRRMGRWRLLGRCGGEGGGRERGGETGRRGGFGYNILSKGFGTMPSILEIRIF